MDFKRGSGVWEMLQKTLASFKSDDLKRITVVYIFKNGSEDPIIVLGPFRELDSGEPR